MEQISKMRWKGYIKYGSNGGLSFDRTLLPKKVSKKVINWANDYNRND